MNENEEPVGSVPLNPIVEEDNTPEVEVENVIPEEAPQKEDKPQESPEAARIAQLEKMLSDSQSMIGQQSSEVGAMRREIEELRKPVQQGPSIEDEINSISDQMEDGEISLKEGNRMIAQLSAKMGEESALNRFSQQQQEERVFQVQSRFLADNPDFDELRQNGALQPYLDADPMADDYVAFNKYKADQQMESLKAEYEAKIAAAKEEGAKLAQGAEATGKVLGKSGSAARAAVTAPKPFKNNREASAAMLAQLRSMRSKT